MLINLKRKNLKLQGRAQSLSLALSLGQSTDSLGTYPADPQAGGDNPEVHGQGEVKTEKRPNLVDRQASTVEYLPGISFKLPQRSPTPNSPAGLWLN